MVLVDLLGVEVLVEEVREGVDERLLVLDLLGVDLLGVEESVLLLLYEVLSDELYLEVLSSVSLDLEYEDRPT